MKNEGLLCFHQGWTDIINSLSLVNYYCERYNKLDVIVRKDARPLMDFYTRTLSNCKVHYVEKNIIGAMKFMNYAEDKDRLFHGSCDNHRNDKYQLSFAKSMNQKPERLPGGHFVEKFFSPYDIPYSTRVDCFNFERDSTLEEKQYARFLIDNTDKPYILYHEQDGAKIDLKQKEEINYVNLNGITENPFSYLKIIENCQELHLVDSVWATFVYLVSLKTPSLSEKPVNLYWLGRPGGILNSEDDAEISPYSAKNFNIVGK